MDMPLASLLPRVAGQTFVIYLFLIAGVRAIGRRQMLQITLLDYVIVALLGSAVESGLYLGGGSFWAGIVSAATLIAANRAVAMLQTRLPWVHRLLVGPPILLVNDGHVVAANLRRARLTERELLSAIRVRGYEGPRVVRYAVLEPNGKIGVVPKEDVA